ncbi:putative bifunctional diguanylate cyclase/phosphodiesterase [Bacillus massiliigorillae]|uniref:putative bifunctional diguanylate cyclase/phosphodiesterase n=1 Tax=Bacillus massiliigorillae TaxID=1243664 RepID=UPI0003A81329|nr:bifunctional diguanylate cyclase/phosphodiesterase [Bacillus massiliigorillae]
MGNNVIQFKHSNDIDYFILMQGKNLFDRAFKRITDSLVIIQVEEENRFRYVYANKYALESLCLTEHSLGKLIEDVHDEGMTIAMKRELKRLMEDETEEMTRFAFDGINTKDSVFEVILLPVKNEEELILYFVGWIKKADDNQMLDRSEQKLLQDIMIQYAKSKELIHFMLHHDLLTGLYNRKALFNNMDMELEKARSDDYEIAILYIDLDRFKLFNESMGYFMGDQLLRNVGDRLLSIEDSNYSVYRISGDNYVIILPRLNRDAAALFATKVYASFDEPFVINQQDYFITPSIGISIYPLDGLDSETLIRKADGALYQVKASGGGHFQFYSNALHEHLPNVFKMEAKLRRALERNELSIYFQPQIDLQTGKITSFEALLRWHNPALGFVSPAEFIPIAEDTGLIIPIGEWVIEEVCRVIKLWTEKGYEPVKVAVNLSPKQFLQPTLQDVIQSLLTKYNIAPSLLEIEITEGAMQDTSEALKMLNKLKWLGVSISVDDFGTGYSSLSYLKQFPLDTLKIDRSFVSEVLSDHKDAAIITTIIYLAHSLGLEVIAEGVETEAQAEFLRSVKCEKAQGFYYSKPLPISEIEERYFMNQI